MPQYKRIEAEVRRGYVRPVGRKAEPKIGVMLIADEFKNAAGEPFVGFVGARSILSVLEANGKPYAVIQKPKKAEPDVKPRQST